METVTAIKQPAEEIPSLPSEWGAIRAGSLGVHIARSPWEIEAAQVLRYRIYYGEMGGTPTEEACKLERDFDQFDPFCDHLLVFDYDLPAGPGQVVGTYRMLRRSALPSLKQFYSEGEFDISAVRQEQGEILELGRSCVDARYRNRAVMQLLWRGIAAYVSLHDIKLLFGCGSFAGTDVKPHALSLSYLYHYHLAPVDLRAQALSDRYVEMNLMPKDAIDVRQAFAALPTLIKGYLRVGSYVGQGAVIDPQCNTIDVSIVVRTDLVADKYAQRYSPTSRSDE